jgi:hypothetical protein
MGTWDWALDFGPVYELFGRPAGALMYGCRAWHMLHLCRIPIGLYRLLWVPPTTDISP